MMCPQGPQSGPMNSNNVPNSNSLGGSPHEEMGPGPGGPDMHMRRGGPPMPPGFRGYINSNDKMTPGGPGFPNTKPMPVCAGKVRFHSTC